MYGDVRITLVGKEQCGTSSSIRGVIVCKFCKGWELRPVVLLIVAIDLEILFQGLLGGFLSVAFRVVAGGEVEFHVKSLPESLEKG